LNGDLKGGRLISVLLGLLNDGPGLREMARKSKLMSRPEAATTVVGAIRELARSN
jgi:hypothetical protein